MIGVWEMKCSMRNPIAAKSTRALWMCRHRNPSDSDQHNTIQSTTACNLLFTFCVDKKCCIRNSQREFEQKNSWICSLTLTVKQYLFPSCACLSQYCLQLISLTALSCAANANGAGCGYCPCAHTDQLCNFAGTDATKTIKKLTLTLLLWINAESKCLLDLSALDGNGVKPVLVLYMEIYVFICIRFWFCLQCSCAFQSEYRVHVYMRSELSHHCLVSLFGCFPDLDWFP